MFLKQPPLPRSTHQDPVTVNDGVEPVSDGEDRALLELVPYGLLDEAVGSERVVVGVAETTAQHKKLPSLNSLGQGVYFTPNNGPSLVRKKSRQD